MQSESPQPRILIVEDEESLRDSLRRVLEKEQFSVQTVESAPAALALLEDEPFQVVVSDIKMPRMTGVELLEAIKERAPQIEVVLMTAYGTIETAVHAMKVGAFDFIEKPFKRDQLIKSVRQAYEKHRLVTENSRLKARLAAIESSGGSGKMIGESPAFQKVLEIIEQVAPTDASVLILGESGTGKELIALEIHNASKRASEPMIALNCASLPESLLESELFGHEKGAFTGAVSAKPGKFELADGGTLFLDEIGEMSLSVQAKMLRVLQEGTFERLGGTKTLRSNVRILSATNQDLKSRIAEKMFREDLFYRLNVISVQLPPLRDRPEDIARLADHFRNRFAGRIGKPVLGFDAKAIDALQGYRWPGNVRELENVIERTVILCKGEIIFEFDLPQEIGQSRVDSSPTLSFPIGTPLKQVEDRMIRATLDRVKGDKIQAAEMLGIASRTIYRKIEEWAQLEADQMKIDNG